MNAILSQTNPDLLVRLPEELKGYREEQGFIPSNIFENRTTARLRVRCESRFGIISSPPFVFRTESQFQVLMKDLSKYGIGIITHQQLYPLETFWVELLGKQIRASVVRCRKLGEKCFEVGGRILY